MTHASVLAACVHREIYGVIITGHYGSAQTLDMCCDALRRGRAVVPRARHGAHVLERSGELDDLPGLRPIGMSSIGGVRASLRQMLPLSNKIMTTPDH